MTVTVRVDYTEDPKKWDSAASCMHRAVILDFFDKITNNNDNIIDDMALILHVDHADIGVVCAHFSMVREQNAIELF